MVGRATARRCPVGDGAVKPPGDAPGSCFSVLSPIPKTHWPKYAASCTPMASCASTSTSVPTALCSHPCRGWATNQLAAMLGGCRTTPDTEATIRSAGFVTQTVTRKGVGGRGNRL